MVQIFMNQTLVNGIMWKSVVGISQIALHNLIWLAISYSSSIGLKYLFLTAFKCLQCSAGSGSKIALVSSEGLELVALSSNTSAVYKLFSVVVPLCSLASPAASLNVAHIVRNSIWLKKNRASENEGKFHAFLMCKIWIYSQKSIS